MDGAFDRSVNLLIGRKEAKKSAIALLFRLRGWYEESESSWTNPEKTKRTLDFNLVRDLHAEYTRQICEIDAFVIASRSFVFF